MITTGLVNDMEGTMGAEAPLVGSLEQTQGYLSKALDGLTQQEADRRAGISPNTASPYIRVLIAEGSLEDSRRIGNARLFRLTGGG